MLEEAGEIGGIARGVCGVKPERVREGKEIVSADVKDVGESAKWACKQEDWE